MDRKRMQNFKFNIVIGQNIKEQREKASMSKQELAQKIEVHFMEIEHLENGANFITKRQIHQFAHFLKVPQATFLQGLPNMPDSIREIESRMNRLTQIAMKAQGGVKNQDYDTLFWHVLNLATTKE